MTKKNDVVEIVEVVGNEIIAHEDSVMLYKMLRAIKEAEIVKKDLMEKLKLKMEEKGIKKFDNDYISVTYIDETLRVGVDADKLKTEHEEVYLECLKETKVSSSVRIKMK